jgi:hypothetical protein
MDVPGLETLNLDRFMPSFTRVEGEELSSIDFMLNYGVY